MNKCKCGGEINKEVSFSGQIFNDAETFSKRKEAYECAKCGKLHWDDGRPIIINDPVFKDHVKAYLFSIGCVDKTNPCGNNILVVSVKKFLGLFPYYKRII